MSLTNFPNGVSSFGQPLPNSGYFTGGKVYWVNYSTGTDGAGRGDSPDNPMKTLDFAIGQCRANKGDIIYLMPGHAESIIAAGTVTADIAGVYIIGLGNGTLRPTFTFSTATTATFLVSAANCLIENVIFDYTGIDAVATGLSITGANNTVNRCRFNMANSTNQAVVAITLGAAATQTHIYDCKFYAPNAGATAAIYGVGATDQLHVKGCWFYGDYATAAINNITAAWTNVLLEYNTYYGTNASEPIIELLTGNTGIIQYNSTFCATFSAAGSIVADGCGKIENYITDTAANSAILDPTVVTL